MSLPRQTLAQVLHKATPKDPVSVRGWISSVRKMKNHAFADLTDGSSPVPLSVILDPKLAEPLTTGSCVRIEGTVQESPGKQRIEVLSKSLTLLGGAGPDYPLQKKFHSQEFLRQLPQFRWKTRSAAQILRYRSWAMAQIQRFFTENDVFQVNSPILTSSDCEGAGETFAIANGAEFFGNPAYLSVSSQLHLEVYAAALSRVWNFAPAFRAEASDTNRHLSEFWMLEAEFAFTESLDDVTDFAERMVRAAIPTGGMAEDILESKRESKDRERLKDRWETLNGPWNSITYQQAVEILGEQHTAGRISAPLVWGSGISSEQEKFLAGQVFKSPVFVTDYPTAIKPFYMKRSPGSMDTVACFDLLIPDVGELIGGSLREDSHTQLLANMRDAGMAIEHMQWYLDLRKYGSFPHGGYGLGFERFIMYVCGLDNIRDAAGFVRGFGAILC